MSRVSSSLSSRKEEFQAVVLAGGKGSRLLDLTCTTPKCLLPVGNVAMIWYSLNMLHNKMGFTSVIVVVHSEQLKAKIGNLKMINLQKLHLDIFVLPSSSGDSSTSSGIFADLGTADALRLIHHKLHSPRIIVMSSDLITNLSIHKLTDLHRIHRSSFTALYRPVNDTKTIMGSMPGPKTKIKRGERDLVGLDPETNRLCYLSSEADLEDLVSVRRSLLQEHPRIKIRTDLMDAHLYIMEKWIVDFIAGDDSITSIRSELFPYLVKKQFSKKLTEKNLKKEDEEASPTNKHNKTENGRKDLTHFIVQDELVNQIQALSNWNDHSGDLKNAYHDRPLRCYAHIMEDVGTEICYRVNNLQTYVDVNRKLPNILSSIAPPSPIQHPKSSIQSKAQVGVECFVGEETLISDKTTIKNCTIGRHCKIEPKVKLTNCILMDNVIVKEGANITGSLICDKVTINQRCDVKDCIIGKGQSVPEGSKRTNELIQEIDRMMEV